MITRGESAAHAQLDQDLRLAHSLAAVDSGFDPANDAEHAPNIKISQVSSSSSTQSSRIPVKFVIVSRVPAKIRGCCCNALKIESAEIVPDRFSPAKSDSEQPQRLFPPAVAALAYY